MFRRTIYTLSIIFASANLAFSQEVVWQREYGAIVNGELMENAYSGGDYGIYWPRHTFVDIDNDQDVDLFIGSRNGNIYHYRNNGDQTNPNWSLVTEFYNSIDVGYNAAPTFCDIDADRDFDMFIGNGYYAGEGGNIIFYRNVGTPDSASWFWETDSLAMLDAYDYSVPTFADIDADGDFDLFVGSGWATIYFCRNIGNPQHAIWDSDIDTNYAETEFKYKNTPTFIDIDMDGDLDLFTGNSYGHLYFYENIGTSKNAVWSLRTKNYAGVDYGGLDYEGLFLYVDDYTAPAFADIDGDGDVDLFVSESVGHHGDIGSSLNFYRNVGNQKAPLWFWETSNYVILDNTIDISSFSVPTFADIDNDGDADMFIGKFQGFISFYRNNGNSLIPNWCLETEGYNEIKVNNYSAPCFADIDADNDLDLFVRSNRGTIYFYQNDGSPDNASWNLITEQYNSISATALTFVDIDADYDLDLFIGNYDGTIKFYQNDGTPENASWNFITDIYDSINVGFPCKPIFADIDDDGDFDLFIGNTYRPYGGSYGGLYFYRNNGDSSSANFLFITDYFNSIDVGKHSTPTFVDIDADGDLDLFVGEQDGGINFWRNITNGLNISGTIKYYFNEKPVANASIILDGNQNITNTEGMFSFIGIPEGNYTMIPSKDGKLGNSISAFDASVILRNVVGLLSLTPYQMISSDVSGNGDVSAFDASYILRYVVGLITEFPIGDDWTFVPTSFAIDSTNWAIAPDSLRYEPLDSDTLNQDFVGIIYGDVSGNWKGSIDLGSSVITEFNIGNIQHHNDVEWLIPLEIKFSNEAYSGSFKVLFNNPDLKFSSSSMDNSLTDNMLFTSNAFPGGVNFAFASAQPLNEQAVKVNILLEEIKSVTPSISEFEFVDVIVDDKSATVTVVENQSSKQVPIDWQLSQNYPNPFNVETSINYQVPLRSHVTIEVFNLLGQRLKTLVNEEKNSGYHRLTWDGKDNSGQTVSTGIYIYKMEADQFVAIKKMILLR